MDATNEHRCFRMQTESTEAGYLCKCLSTIDNAYNETSKWRKKTFSSVLRYLSENDGGGGGGVLPLIDDAMAQLGGKHRNPQEARLGPLLFGPVEDVPD